MERDENSKPWQRFTWRNAILLLLAMVLGCFISFAMHADAQTSPQTPLPWPAQAGPIELVIVGLILGSTFVSPAILLSQWIFGKRRQWLHLGEYLWLSPLILYLATYFVSNLTRPTPFWFFLFVAGIAISSSASIIALIVYPFKRFQNQTCPWTNLFGMISCLSVGILISYNLIVDPIYI